MEASSDKTKLDHLRRKVSTRDNEISELLAALDTAVNALNRLYVRHIAGTLNSDDWENARIICETHDGPKGDNPEDS